MRRVTDVIPVEWGNGLSRRLLLDADGLGYTLTDTLVRAGTRSLLVYKSHFEVCYCISGIGEVIEANGGGRHVLRPGTMYALEQHDPHCLIAYAEEDLRLICVFSPALVGNERHILRENEFSHY